MKKKMMKRVVSFALAMMMAITAIMFGGVEEAKAADTYEIVVTNGTETVEKDATTTVKTGVATTLTAKVFKNGIEVTNMGDEGLTLWWSSETLSVNDSESLLSNTVTINAEETHWITLKLKDSTWAEVTSTWFAVKAVADSTVTPPSNPTEKEYALTVTADKTSVETGGQIVLTAELKEDGRVLSELPEGFKIAFYPDGTGTGKTNATYTADARTSFTDTITLNEEGTFYFVAALYNTNVGWDPLKTAYVTLTATGAAPTTPVYTIEATTEKTSVEEDGTVKITAAVKKDGVVVPQDELANEDLQVWFWADQWKAGHENGLVDATFANYDNNSGYSLTADITLPSAGTYYIMAELRETAPSETEKGAWVAEKCVTLTATAASSDGGQGAGSEPQPETTPEPEVKEEEKPVVIELDNSNFSTATDGTWTGEIAKGEWKDGNDMQVLSYSSDSYLELPSYVGTTGLKFNMEQGNTMTISQWVDSLKAGTYTITAPVMGENTDVYLVLGDKEIKATSLSGYNSWTKAKATFTIKEDMTDVKVGFKLVATSSGENSWSWGWIDSIQLIKTVPGTGDATNIYAYVLLLMAGIALVGYSVKRNKVQF